MDSDILFLFCSKSKFKLDNFSVGCHIRFIGCTVLCQTTDCTFVLCLLFKVCIPGCQSKSQSLIKCFNLIKKNPFRRIWFRGQTTLKNRPWFRLFLKVLTKERIGHARKRQKRTKIIDLDSPLFLQHVFLLTLFLFS